MSSHFNAAMVPNLKTPSQFRPQPNAKAAYQFATGSRVKVGRKVISARVWKKLMRTFTESIDKLSQAKKRKER